MRILICAGGTGGHIYPALTLADGLVMKNHNVDFIGSLNRMEKDIIPERGYKFIGLDIDNFNGGILGKFKGLGSFMTNYFKAKKIVKGYDLVIGFGNYISVPIILAAKNRHIKTYIHEQNSIPGKANLLLDRFVDGVFCSMEHNLKYFKNKHLFVYGNPQSSLQVNEADEAYFDEFNLDRQMKTVLMFFGSLGSMSVDNFMQKFLKDFDEDYQIIYACGSNYIKNYQAYQNAKVRVVERVDGYKLMGICDLLVSRAGATTISEITSIGVASIMIPSPYVANNHQYFNALELVEKNAALLLEEGKMNVEYFNSLIKSVIFDEDKLNDLRANSLKFAKKDALERMIEEVTK